MREHPYIGPSGTNDFDHLPPDEAARLMQAYRYLGDAFGTQPEEELLGKGWLSTTGENWSGIDGLI